MNYEAAMAYIRESWKLGSNYGLERVYRLLELLDHPEQKVKVIHIAGTNGKGSTTAMITKCLQEIGYKVGMYTSPWLEVYEEKLQINGEKIQKTTLAHYVTRLKDAVDQVIAEGFPHPTEFEMITALMFLYFYEERVDYAVVEVGLGGAMDATNVMTPEVSVIVSISLDHMQILGNSLEEIARQKAGIIKAGVPVMMYPQVPEVEAVLYEVAQEKGAPICQVTREMATLRGINQADHYQEVVITGTQNQYEIKLPLLGAHQVLNAAVAVCTVEAVCKKANRPVEVAVIQKALSEVKWMGRLEVLNKKPLVVIDGAHNIDGIRALAHNIPKYFKYRKLYLLLGILADKEVEAMIETIVPLADKVYALTPQSDRAELCEDLKAKILPYVPEVEAIEDYEEAAEKALQQAGAEDLVLVSGSLYLIGSMRGILINKL